MTSADQPRRGPWAAVPFDGLTFMLAAFVRDADAARHADQPEAAEQLERLADLAATEAATRREPPP